jgi:hypothetical protein
MKKMGFEKYAEDDPYPFSEAVGDAAHPALTLGAMGAGAAGGLRLQDKMMPYLLNRASMVSDPRLRGLARSGAVIGSVAAPLATTLGAGYGVGRLMEHLRSRPGESSDDRYNRAYEEANDADAIMDAANVSNFPGGISAPILGGAAGIGTYALAKKLLGGANSPLLPYVYGGLTGLGTTLAASEAGRLRPITALMRKGVIDEDFKNKARERYDKKYR